MILKLNTFNILINHQCFWVRNITYDSYRKSEKKVASFYLVGMQVKLKQMAVEML